MRPPRIPQTDVSPSRGPALDRDETTAQEPETVCVRCLGCGRITLINVDLGGGFYGDADDQPCPECGE